MTKPASSSSNNNHDQDQLPQGWSRTWSNSQKRYYYSHVETHHTQWHFPTAREAQDPWLAKQRVDEKRQHQQKSNSSGSGSTPSSTTKRPRPHDETSPASAKKPKPTTTTTSTIPKPPNNKTNIAIIVPYRDLHKEQHRAQHLQQFVPHMIRFLSTTNPIQDFHVYIVEQSNDQRKFNRGKLLNIGYDLAKRSGRHHNVYCFHDVDLLPQDDLQQAYAKFPKHPYHIARVWNRYSNNPKYFGGVVSMSAPDFESINGYPNTFWGWGGEDDELQLRCEARNLSWEFPKHGTLVDLEAMELHEKLQFLRQHKEWKCMVKWEALKEHSTTWKQNGLADLQYQVLKTVSLDSKTNKASKITVDVKLNGQHWANNKCHVDFQGDWNK